MPSNFSLRATRLDGAVKFSKLDRLSTYSDRRKQWTDGGRGICRSVDPIPTEGELGFCHHIFLHEWRDLMARSNFLNLIVCQHIWFGGSRGVGVFANQLTLFPSGGGRLCLSDYYLPPGFSDLPLPGSATYLDQRFFEIPRYFIFSFGRTGGSRELREAGVFADQLTLFQPRGR